MAWGWGFWGMSIFWWLFWVLALVIFFSLLTPVPRSRLRDRRETPLDILQRRHAAGELTTAEYDERRARLPGDQPVRSSTGDRAPPTRIEPPPHQLPH